MLAERSFGCLATATVAILAIMSCAPIARRQDPTGGAGGSGSGGMTGTGGVTETGGTTETGGVTETGGTTETGGVTETGGAATGGTTDAGGTTGPGGIVGSGGTTGLGGVAGAGGTANGGTSGLGGLGGTTSTVCGVSTSYGWASTQSLMDPVSDGSHALVGIKAPSVVRYNNKYHVFATVLDSAAKPNIQYISFADWANAPMATVDFLDNNPGFSGPRSQPQVFYFTPKKTWYLITQSGPPAYSTNADITLARSWTSPANFYSATPTIVTQNAGTGGIGWTDFWTVCDTANCYMFFTNQKGYLFRAKTSIGSFPSGFGDPVIVMQSSYLVEGGRIYQVKGSDKYLMVIEGTGSGGRFIGSWSATALDGKWTALAETEANPFAGAGNSTFVGSKWTKDVGHGELVRDSYDETMTVDNCNMRYFYAGKDRFSTVKAEPFPWKLGLLVRSK